MPFGIASPNPMTDDGIDAGTYEQGDDEIAAKSHAFRDGPGNNGGGGSTKGELKEEEGP